MSATEDLLALLRDATSPEDLQRRLLTPEEQLLWQRLAPASVFDAELVRRLAPPGVAPWTELVARPFVAGCADGRFRLRTATRQAYMERWLRDAPAGEIPVALVELSRELYEHFAGQDRTEALRHRLLASTQDGLEELEAAFAAGEQRFDLARCRDLLDVLADRASLLEGQVETQSLLEDYQRRLDTCGLWLDEYLRTDRFLLPAESELTFSALLDGTTRTLDLHAPGGYGKTIHLRWLLARRCVGARIPCARVDFDTVDLLAATREPHLLLLELGHQLGWQLPEFGGLLSEFFELRERLHRRDDVQTILAGDSALEGEGAVDDIPEQIVDGFVRGLHSAERVVVVLDTLEETLVVPEAGTDRPAAARLLELLAAVQERAPMLRIVFAGRYSIADRVPELARRFAGARSYPLPKLSEQEAVRYLTECRELRNPELVPAAVSASKCVPFNLALVADVIAGQPGITAEQVKALPADQLYLIERIIDRLPNQPLRWLLRYAALPRRLDFEFVRDVLVPRVAHERSDNGTDDVTSGPEGTRTSWYREAASEELNAEALWRQLQQYVGDSSWITRHPIDSDVLLLQSEVVRPMRELLSVEATVTAVHAAAASYFERRASAEDHAAPLLREAVFHRFQLGGPAASLWWRQKVDDSDPAARYALAEELANELTFLHDYGPQRVDDDTRAYAWLALAESSLELAVEGDVPREHTLFHEAETALASLDRARSQALVPPTRLALARAGVLLNRIDLVDAGPEVERALAEAQPDSGAWLQVLYARRRTEARVTGGRQSLPAILTRTRRGPDRDRLIRELVLGQALDDDLAAALDTLDGARANGDLHGHEFQLLRSYVLTRLGAYTPALDATDGADSPRRVDADAARARILLLQGRPDLVAQLEPRTRSLAKRLDDARARRERADLERLAGTARARLLDVERARDFLGRAQRHAAQVSAFDVVGWAHNAEAELSLYGLGNLRAAGVAVDKAQRVAVDGGEAALRAAILRANLTARLEGVEATARLWPRLRELGDTPRRRAVVAVAELASGPDDALAAAADRLAAALDEFRPFSAGLPALSGLARAARVVDSPALARHAGLDASLPLPGSPHDQGIALLRLADLQRICGQTARAADTLRHASQRLSAPLVPPVIARYQLRLASRLGDQALTCHLAQDAIEAGLRFEDEFPLLAAAVIIEAAEADPQTPVDTLALVPRLLDRAGSVAEAWHARLELLHADQPHRHIDAASHRQAAIELFEQVGDQRRADQERERLHAPPPLPGNRPAFVLSVMLEPDRFVVEYPVPWGAPEHTEPRGPLVDDLLSWQRQTTRQLYPKRLADRLAADPGIADELRRMLPTRPAAPETRLRIRDAALQLVPWELARRPIPEDAVFYRGPWRARPDVRAVHLVQAGLNEVLDAHLAVDGIGGPATLAALARLMPEADGIDDPEAVQRLHQLCLRQAPAAFILAGEQTRSAGDDLLRHYFGCAYDAEFASGPYAIHHQLEHVLASTPPPVLVHLCGTFAPLGGAVALELTGSRNRATDSALLTTTELDRHLRTVAPDWVTPVVVLDAIAPPIPWEQANQVLLRNLFAAELFALGGARAVIGTGLVSYEHQFSYREILVGGLAGGSPLGDMVSRLQSFPGAESLGFGASALWCEDPRIRLP